MARRAILVSLLLWLVPFGFAQSDPQALSYAAQAIAALTGGTAIYDVTLTGTATRTAGSDVGTGSATLHGKGQYESRVDLILDSGNRSDILNLSSGPAGNWIDSNAKAHRFAESNCMTDAVWFFPALSSLAYAMNPAQRLSYVGQETLNGASVQHLRSVWSGRRGSTVDFYLDAATLLPVETDFQAHPDTDPSRNVPIQILFSSYRNVNGVVLPFHVQQLLNGSVLLDFEATSAVFNSGLSDNLFAIQ